jgi:hypothetical protein
MADRFEKLIGENSFSVSPYAKVHSSLFLPNLVLRSFLSCTHEPINAYPWMAFDLH